MFAPEDYYWERPTYEGVDLPNHLSEQSRQFVQRLASPRRLCIELCQYFSRHKLILPTERVYTQERRAISGIRLANERYHGLAGILRQAERNLKALEQCTPTNPCKLIGCPYCSPEMRASAMHAAVNYICSVIAYNAKRHYSETVVLSVTLANRSLWCRPLKDVAEVLKGRRNTLRNAIKKLAASKLEGLGRVTDVLASLDMKYDSPIDPNQHNSEDNVVDRLAAECDVHVHALVCFSPYHQQFLRDQDWAGQIQRALTKHFP